MINKELIELQKGCKATCVVIKNEDINELDSKIVINNNVTDEELINVFKDINDELNYLLITGIDGTEAKIQERFYQIIKDREFKGYILPENIIIILTVKDKENLKNIKQEIYNLCIVAF